MKVTYSNFQKYLTCLGREWYKDSILFFSGDFMRDFFNLSVVLPYIIILSVGPPLGTDA